MPDPAKVAFLRENKEEVSNLIIRENTRRERRQMPSLTDDEIDEYLASAMDAVKSGQRIRSAKFPDAEAVRAPVESAQEQTETNPQIEAIRQSRLARQGSKSKQSSTIQSNSAYVMEAVVCNNGFLLSVATQKGVEQFVFRNKRELMQIFDDIVFVELKKLKEMKVNNEKEENIEKNGKVMGRSDRKPANTEIPNKKETQDEHEKTNGSGVLFRRVEHNTDGENIEQDEQEEASEKTKIHKKMDNKDAKEITETMGSV